jgi:predicted PurR-regulated permease PerM
MKPRPQEDSAPLIQGTLDAHETRRAGRQRVWRTTAVVFGFAAILAAVVMLWPVLAPAIIGASLSYATFPLVQRIEKLGLSRTWAVTLFMGALAGLVAVLVLLILPSMIEQTTDFISTFGDIGARIRVTYEQTVRPFFSTRLRVKLPRFADGLTGFVAGHADELGPRAWNALTAGANGALTFAALMLNVVLIPFFMFYFLRDYETYRDSLASLLPPRWRARFQPLAHEIDGVLAAYFRGTMTVIATETVLYIIAFMILGVPLAVAFAMISGLLFLLPYVGGAGSWFLTVAWVLLNGQGLADIAWLTVAFLVINQIENWILIPYMVGERLGLSAWETVLVVTAGGFIGGFTGLALALPVGATFKVVVRYSLTQWKASGFYGAE